MWPFVNHFFRTVLQLCVFSGLYLNFPSLLAQTLQLPPPDLITDRQGLPQAFVPAIVQDHQGFIWAATRDGLCRYDGQHFRVFQPDPDGRPSLSSTGLENLFLDHRGRIWIISEHGDIDIFEPRTERFINFSRSKLYRRAMGSRRLYKFYVDRQNRLWVALQAEGILCFDLRTNQVRHFRHQVNQPRSLQSDSIMQVNQAPNGAIWIATRDGLERFDETTRQFIHYQHQAGQPGSLPDNQLCGLQIRPNGEVLTVSQRFISRLNPATGQFRAYPLPVYTAKWWDGHYTIDTYGTMYFHQNKILYRFTDRQGPVVVARWNQVIDQCASLCIDRSQVLWLGTNGAGIRKYNLRAFAFRSESYQRNFYHDVLTQRWLGVPVDKLPPPTALAGLNSYNFRYTISQNRYLWCNVASSDVYRIDLLEKRSDKIPLPVSFYEGDNIDAIPCPLATDPEQRVWAIYDKQVWWFNEQQQRWASAPYRIPTKQTSRVLAFVADEQALWLATKDAGLWRLDRATGMLRQYANQPRHRGSLSSNSIFCLSDDPQDPNRLWIGTFGSGLCAFDKQTGISRRITQQNGLPNNVIYSVIPDQQGYLWMGTNKGICRLDRRTFRTKNYTRADGLMADEFNRFHWLHLPDDRIIMGGLEGITVFDPRQVGDDTFQPRIELTGLSVNNLPAAEGTLDSLPIQAVSQLVLPHDQNFITAEFAALQFNRPGKNRYRYRLDGLETDWKETDRPVATYTNLPPNNYVLVLNGSNTSGRWSRYSRKLWITIRPPLWATWWAYVVYVLIFGGVLVVGFRLSLNRLKMRQAIAMQQREIALNHQKAKHLKAVDELKSNFFANITHEFRTPLTLILGPAERLRQYLNSPDEQRLLTTIDHNANQLLGLVNQLLDLSKLEGGALPVVETRGELGPFVTRTVDSFREAADAKGVGLNLLVGNLADSYWFDADKLERIQYNLLANALKFTPKGGHIRVNLNPTPTGVQLIVTDTGRGIPAAQLPLIFDRFYQRSADAANPHGQPDEQPGTGIGLALVNELVNVQKGQVSVTSELGKGSTFVVDLPYRPVATVPHNELVKHTPVIMNLREQNTENPDERPLVMVVEDNDELARFILENLPADYRAQRANNGQMGLNQALSDLPDLIISDVLMPVMDGFTLCRHLKTDPRTNHIPIILLTAKATLDNRLEGLMQGANDYMTKPFLVPELQLRVRNQINSIRTLREWVITDLSQPAASSPSATETTQPTDPFLSQLYALINEHLDDPAFGVDELPRPLGLSRMSLYRKIKALTGLAPVDVLRLYRLKRATEFLQTGLSVTETAERIGFQTASHFGKVFREQYGLSPGQFARKIAE